VKRGTRRALIAGLAVVALGLGAFIGLMIYRRVTTGEWAVPKVELVEIKRTLTGASEPEGAPKVIYLHRVPITLTGGEDDAARNRSSIVASFGKQKAELPGWSGTAKGWKALVECVRSKFAPFDVEVTEERPVGGNYILVAVGGTPKDLGIKREVGGLAPFSGDVIPRAIVLAFAKKLGNRTRETCDVIGMEVAHAYGLDHTYECRDLMTYRSYCGTKRFVDKDMSCGETRRRPCAGDKATQNSYRMLLRALGPARPSTAAAPVQ
jgi:hypothetical protein